jgi:hypothetical protein
MNEPMPGDFGWRYMLWTLWCGTLYALKWIWAQAITMLSTAQIVFAALTLPENQTLVSHAVYHEIQLGALILTIVLAQIKRTHPNLKE